MGFLRFEELEMLFSFGLSLYDGYRNQISNGFAKTYILK